MPHPSSTGAGGRAFDVYLLLLLMISWHPSIACIIGELGREKEVSLGQGRSRVLVHEKDSRKE